MKPILLAPAGNLEKLKWAVYYGADAVYFGMEFGSLRSFAGNFTLDDAKEGLDFLHANGKKGFVTLNIYPFSDEYQKIIGMAKLLDEIGADAFIVSDIGMAKLLDEIGADAFIVSDIGVLTELAKLKLKAELHISTQANTTSWQSVLAFANLGAKSVNLARELSLEQIEEIQNNVRGKVETEIFIHGSVCFSYSGRCAISDYLTGRRANRGECTHPCRWKYYLVEEDRPGKYMPVAEDSRGLYFFNSKELALFEYIPRLINAGVNCFKVEGRMKSIHYIASTVSFYRQVIDGRKFTKEQAFELLNRVPNRGYSAGFIKGGITPDDYNLEKSHTSATSVFVANSLPEKRNGKTVLEIRNKTYAGETLEMLCPDGSISTVTIPSPLILSDGATADFANNSQFVLIDQNLPPNSILRRIAGEISDNGQTSDCD